MTRPVQRYQSDAIEVTFDPNLCIHSGRCLMSLPRVFDVGRRKWVDPTAASADRIARAIERCPSGALRYHRLDTEADEEPDAVATATPTPNGPLFVRGNLEIHASDGRLLATGTRFSLCRCGASQNKPFCDTSHRSIGFEAP